MYDNVMQLHFFIAVFLIVFDLYSYYKTTQQYKSVVRIMNVINRTPDNRFPGLGWDRSEF